MFMFSTLLASKLVRIVTRIVKEACGVPTVAMCRSFLFLSSVTSFSASIFCPLSHIIHDHVVKQECGCVYDVREAKIIFATLVNANLQPCKSRTMFRLWSGDWASEDIFSSAAIKHSFSCFKWCESGKYNLMNIFGARVSRVWAYKILLASDQRPMKLC